MYFKTLLGAAVACALIACVVGSSSTTTLSTTSTDNPTPETTTASTTTSSSTTSPPAPPPTSTPKPTTPAPSPVTTTPPPPAPSDERGNWTVVDGNVTCIIAQMIVSAKISYPLVTANKTGTVEITVPHSAKAKGACDSNTQYVTISWDKNNLNLTFGRNDSTKMYFINHIVLSVLADEKTFPNISDKLVNTSIKFERKSAEFKTAINQSYRCIREESLPLFKPNSTSNEAVLVLNKVQLQAFHNKERAEFGNAQDCELDTPDIVPIAVGCALALLVCVVLVAYLIGRRRSQARGYLSM